MRTRIFPLLALFVLLLASCGKSNKFSVLGDIKGMPTQLVLLRELGLKGNSTVIDSVMTSETGTFELKGEITNPGLYQLIFTGGRQYILLSIDKGNVKISADWRRFTQVTQDYKVEGSPASESLRNFLGVYHEDIKNIRTLDILADTLHAMGKDSLVTKAIDRQREFKKSLDDYTRRYADTTIFFPNAWFAANTLDFQTELPFIQGFAGSLGRRFPNNPQIKDFTEVMNERMAKMKGDQGSPLGAPMTSMIAPEITANTPDGKEVKLSSFRGKYVLVDFWASWCGPCRHENPNVVAAYNKFKDKNFTILGVSLDDKIDAWKAAIEKDHLTWTHISDLKGWQSIPARDYDVHSIPANFLLDTAGRIIARDLREGQLEAKLAEVLK